MSAGRIMSGMGKPSLSMTGKFPLAIQRRVLMVVCESCGGNCDHGELVQGVCPECLEEERKRKENAALLEKLEGSSFWQMELEVWNGYNYDFDRKI